MVKADVKRDYYADLELPATADADEIKRQFRILAKQYHPDRNPGREVDVVAKFQAVQAAHEILSDPVQKAKYDADRAKLPKPNNISTPNDLDPYNFRKPATKVPNTTGFPPPPPPRRAATSYGQDAFRRSTGRAKATPAASGAEKFNAFTRAVPQQWDRARFDAATQAEAARGFQSMRGNLATPQPPLRSTRPPTAQRPYDWSNTSPTDSSNMPGAFSGHPGMSRTASTRIHGFNPGDPVGDEPMATRTSAYAATNNRGRAPPSAYPSSPPVSPSMADRKPVVSPLRHVRSSDFDNAHPLRPGLDRNSTRYAANIGEKTKLEGDIGRSASVRTSSNGPKWTDSDHESQRPRSHQGPVRPRYRSASPKVRPAEVNVEEFSSSESESSSGEEMPTMKERPKAQIRKPRKKQDQPDIGSRYKSSSGDEPAFTAQFPSNLYTKIVDEGPTTPYEYPPPEYQDVPVRRPFPNVTILENGPFSNATSNKNGEGQQMKNGTPKSYNLQSHPNPSINPALFGGVQETDSLRKSNQGTPQTRPNSDQPNVQSTSQENIRKIFSDSDWDGKFSEDGFIRPTDPHTSTRDRKSPSKNFRERAKSTGNFKSATQVDPKSATAEDEPVAATSDSTQSYHSATQDRESTNATAFQPGKFSADEWSEKWKGQKWSILNDELTAGRSRTPKRGTRPPNNRRPPAEPLSGERLFQTMSRDADTEETPAEEALNSFDAMDIDSNSNSNTPLPTPQPAPPTINEIPPTPSESQHNHTNGVSLESLTKTAPFAPSETGLKDLSDLTTTLPFESKAASTIPPLDSEADLSHTSRFIRPRPPKTIDPPDINHLTQESWQQYVVDMNAYLHDWNVFNVKMLDHFRARQDQVQLGMGRNWISSVGDGPSAIEFDALNRGDGLLGGKPAGFATYMAWLEEDAKCRVAWDLANERHRKCFEELARVREKVKAVAGVA